MVVNNLGAETHVHYAPSTKFYLKDKEDGKPWIEPMMGIALLALVVGLFL